MDKNRPKSFIHLLEIKGRLLLPRARRPKQVRNRRLLRHHSGANGFRNDKAKVNVQRLQQCLRIQLRHEASLRQLRQIQRHRESHCQARHINQESLRGKYETDRIHELIHLWLYTHTTLLKNQVSIIYGHGEGLSAGVIWGRKE